MAGASEFEQSRQLLNRGMSDELHTKDCDDHSGGRDTNDGAVAVRISARPFLQREGELSGH
jgi:hypothetical protein